MKFKLKENLLLGTATAATQIEGGDENNNWARFAAEGRARGLRDGGDPGVKERKKRERNALVRR